MKRVVVLIFSLLSMDGFTHEKIKIVTEQYPPFQQVTDSQQITGTTTRLIRLLMDEAKLPYDIFVYPWPRALKELENSPSVLLYSMLKLPTRESRYQWLAPLCPVKTSFYHLTSRRDIKIKTLSDIVSYRIGIERAQGKTDFLIEQGFAENLVAASTNQQLRKMMLFNRIDLILISDAYAESLPEQERKLMTKAFTVEALTQFLYLVGHPNMNRELKQRLIDAYKSLKAQQKFICHM